MRRVGETDPLIARAIVLYCKAYFGYDDQTERWQACYDGLRDQLWSCRATTERRRKPCAL